MTEHEIGARLARHLDATSGDLKPEVLDRLSAARQAAVACAASQLARRFVWSGGALGLGILGGDRRYALVASALLIAIVTSYYYWQNQVTPAEMDDVELLSGELPVNAYLDKGFDKWVTGSLSR